MKKKKLNKKEVISTNGLGVVFGHKVDDMKDSIAQFEKDGLDIVVITWPKYWLDFDGYEVHTQKTPINQGTDCIKLVKNSDLFDYNDEVRVNANELITKRYETLYGIEDINF